MIGALGVDANVIDYGRALARSKIASVATKWTLSVLFVAKLAIIRRKITNATRVRPPPRRAYDQPNVRRRRGPSSARTTPAAHELITLESSSRPADHGDTS